MKKIGKALAMILLFFAVIPAIAGWAITALWNGILISACGFTAITFWQGVGIFILGQILSGGFTLGGFFTMGSLHHAMGHHRGGMRNHWHDMTEEERRAFMEKRSAFWFGHKPQTNEDAAE